MFGAAPDQGGIFDYTINVRFDIPCRTADEKTICGFVGDAACKLGEILACR